MGRWRRGASGLAVAAAVLALAGCGASTPAAEELHSLASQARLLAGVAADGSATGSFVDVQADELRRELDALSVPDGELAEVESRLRDLLARLPQASREEAARLEQELRAVVDDAAGLEESSG